jgi:acyl-CoA synthetase (AMP-forming)/AMP-acid ligase II
MLGGLAVLEDRWDDASSFDLLVTEQATFYGGPDVVLRRLLDEADRRAVTTVPLQGVSVGGTQLDGALLRRAEERFGICVMRAYGSSEAPFSTTTPRNAPRPDRLELDGRPNRGVLVRIGSGRDASECLVRGPHLFLGYLDAADNEDAFEEGWFRTGDAGTFGDEQLKIVGRLKEVVVRNGLKISMASVEDAARALDFVADAAAFGRLDGETGEPLALAVRPPDGVAPPDLATVTAALRAGGLSTRSLPEELVIWTEPFPMTATHKLDRAALAEQSSARPRFYAARLQP